MTDTVNYLEEKMNKWEELKERERLEQIAYEKMCFACPNAKKCHEECENCDDFENEVERLVALS